METLKIKNVAVGLGGTASNVNTALSVVITNANTTHGTLITQNTAAGVTVGTVVVAPATMVVLVKANTDTLQSSITTAVSATACGFSN